MNRSRYWTLHAINGLGQHQPYVLEQIQTFIPQQPLVDLTDRQVQAHLVALEQPKLWAHFSLRCFISAILLYECLDKAKTYGTQHQFTATELFPLVMDPRPTTDLRQYPIPHPEVSLTSKILLTFSPEKSNLSTYTKLCLKGWGVLKEFFLDHGLLEVTNWFLLSDRRPSGLARILTDYSFPRSCSTVKRQGSVDSDSLFTYSPAEVKAAVALHHCFHQVYVQQRQAAGTYRKPYLPPSPGQLQEMGRILDRDPEAVNTELLTLAKILRHYLVNYASVQSEDFSDPDEPELDPQEQVLFQHLLPHLNAAVEQVICHRYRHHKKAKKRAQFKEALDLFFGQSIPTVEIAQRLGISQSTASRLLDLNPLREDVTVEILVQAPQDILLKLGCSAPPPHPQLTSSRPRPISKAFYRR
ncbi:sigma-70 family RNA polymerase sigma factor (plasmid) [Acaryochloris sp. 'Moss Beach']|uniref:hypothetical protein n=1 Tax=Acaryochloris sp. 'Moss Beach' TaxID=2740837 RepID=UPI001F2478E1|nr:hypothetical protein [Acaryochloris sp. 'Moss Beach']UJB73016.1 sigma-70 family RNA polymerase sigma factor [Acaryochloris sp. 'Moss Beach']